MFFVNFENLKEKKFKNLFSLDLFEVFFKSSNLGLFKDYLFLKFKKSMYLIYGLKLLINFFYSFVVQIICLNFYLVTAFYFNYSVFMTYLLVLSKNYFTFYVLPTIGSLIFFYQFVTYLKTLVNDQIQALENKISSEFGDFYISKSYKNFYEGQNLSSKALDLKLLSSESKSLIDLLTEPFPFTAFILSSFFILRILFYFNSLYSLVISVNSMLELLEIFKMTRYLLYFYGFIYSFVFSIKTFVYNNYSESIETNHSQVETEYYAQISDSIIKGRLTSSLNLLSFIRLKIRNLYNIFSQCNQKLGVLTNLDVLIESCLFYLKSPLFINLIYPVLFTIKLVFKLGRGSYIPFVFLPLFLNILNSSMFLLEQYATKRVSAGIVCNILELNRGSFYLEPKASAVKGGVDLQVKNLSFSITSGTKTIPILKNISFKISKGEKVAIIGGSGAGKSVLSYLCSGYPIIDPSIKLSEGNLRDNILYIAQDSQFYRDSLLNNIVCGQNYELASLYDLRDFYYLDVDFNRSLTNNAFELSGGQKQRVALMRAHFLHQFQKQNILIFDESISALDEFLKNDLIKKILNHYSEQTVLFVLHDLNNLKYFDKVLLLREGCLEKYGPTQQVLQSSQYQSFLHEKI